MPQSSDLSASSTRRCILVTGMHRSGTSALTRVLNLAGAVLPRVELMPPAPDQNPTGFWEALEVCDIHQSFMAKHGHRWDDFRRLPDEAFAGPLAEEMVGQLAAFLNRAFLNKDRLFVIKDPRLCQVIPLWLQALKAVDVEALFVIPTRNPLEVAASLHARDRIAFERAALIWLRHVVEAEHFSRGNPRSFVTYSGLLADWRETLAKIARDLNLHWDGLNEFAAQDVTAFLTKELKHHAYSLDDMRLDSRIHQWAGDCCAALAEQDDPAALAAIFDRVRDELNRAEDAFAPLLAQAAQENSVQAQAAAQARHGMAEQAAQLAQRDASVAQVSATLAARDARVGELEGNLVRTLAEVSLRDGRIGEFQAYAAHLAKELAVKDGRIAEYAVHCRNLDAIIVNKDKDASELTAQLEERAERIRACDVRIAGLESDLGVLQNRNSVLEGAVATLEAEKAVLAAGCNALEDAVATLEAEKAVLAADCNALEDAVATLAVEKAVLAADRSALEVATLEAEKVVLAADRSALEGVVATLETEKAVLAADKDVLERDKASLEREAIRLAEEMAEQDRLAAEVRAETARINGDKLAELGGALAKAGAEAEKLLQEVARQAAVSRALEDRLVQMDRDAQVLRREFHWVIGTRYWRLRQALGAARRGIMLSLWRKKALRRQVKKDVEQIANRGGIDTEFYLHAYPDVARSGVPPLLHYALYGWREGRRPTASFDTSWYLGRNPDVRATGMNPYLHYLAFGAAEGRPQRAAEVSDSTIVEILNSL